MKNFFSTLAIVGVLALPSAPAVRANELGAAIAGAILGGVVINEVNKNNRRSPRSSSGSTVSSTTRAHNAQTQRALNYFGFNAGSPDGVLGSRSRAASRQLQAYVGFPVTGRLNQYERDFLMSSYSRAQMGGASVSQAVQKRGDGIKSVLVVWREEELGIRPTYGQGQNGHRGVKPTGGSHGQHVGQHVGQTGGQQGGQYAGMPPEVSTAIDEIAASSDPSGTQLLQRSGFVQLADLNGDGRTDYILNTAVTGSSFWCGDQSCSVMVFASGPQGYARNDFLTRDATPAAFQCQQSACRLTAQRPDTGFSENGQMASAQIGGQIGGQTGGQIGGQATRQPGTALTPSAGQQFSAVMAAADGNSPTTVPIFAPQQAAATAVSLTSHCATVGLMTSSNGGYVTQAAMTDADLALNEQFCVARTYAIGAGERMAQASTASQKQVDDQCDGLVPATMPLTNRLGQGSVAELMPEIRAFVLGTGMSPQQLHTTAAICMYSGYRRDNMPVAIGSVLVMVGLGQRPYAELIGHHVSRGFGVNKRADSAQEWFDMALAGLAAGDAPVFAPGHPERSELLRAALRVNSTPPTQAFVMPAFELGGN
jgi:peptidoglycan hydrolase-like protein with peptidoglycan-binding domain